MNLSDSRKYFLLVSCYNIKKTQLKVDFLRAKKETSRGLNYETWNIIDLPSKEVCNNFTIKCSLCSQINMPKPKSMLYFGICLLISLFIYLFIYLYCKSNKSIFMHIQGRS